MTMAKSVSHSMLLGTLLLVSTLILQSTVECIRCYICDSKDDFECSEKFPSNARLQPKECVNITNAAYCIKTTNIYGGELGTKRFCSANDHGNYCKWVRQPTGDKEYRSCILTCSEDACNASPQSLLYNIPTNSFLMSLLAQTTIGLFIYLISSYYT